jgi:hypothetical protein
LRANERWILFKVKGYKNMTTYYLLNSKNGLRLIIKKIEEKIKGLKIEYRITSKSEMKIEIEKDLRKYENDIKELLDAIYQ